MTNQNARRRNSTDWQRTSGGGGGAAPGTAGQWRRYQRGVRRGTNAIRQVSLHYTTTHFQMILSYYYVYLFWR